MSNFIHYIEQVLILQLIFLIVYYVLFKKDKFFNRNRIYLLLTLILPILIPLFKINMGWFDTETILYTNNQINAKNLNIVASPNSASPIQQPQNSSLVIIAYIYAIGCIVMFLNMTIAYIRLSQIIRKSEKISFFNYVLSITKEKLAPFSFFKWIVVSKKEKTDLQEILTHEKIHCAQYHSIDILLCDILKILFWFNPMSWVLKRIIVENNEFNTDKIVLEGGANKKDYQYSLCKITIGTGQLAMVNNFNDNLKNRIKMMNSMKTPKSYVLKNLMIIPLVCVCLVILSAFSKTEKIVLKNKINSESKITHKKKKEKKSSYIVTISKNGKAFKIKDINGTRSFYINNKKVSKKRYNKEFAQAKDKDVKIAINNKHTGVKNKSISVTTKDGKTFMLERNGDEEQFFINNKKVSKKEYQKKIIDKEKRFYTNTHTYSSNSSGNSNSSTNFFSSRTNKSSTFTSEFTKDGVVCKIIGVNGKKSYYINNKIVSEEEFKNYSNKKININNDTLKTHFEKNGNTKVNAVNNVQIKLGDNKKDKPLIYINGKEYLDKFENIDQNNIKSISIFKDKTAIDHFGKKAKNGVMLIITKDSNYTNDALFKKLKVKEDKAEKKSNERKSSINGDYQPIIIVNGKEFHGKLKDLDHSLIIRMKVIKREAAIKKYGAKAKFGVIEIVSKQKIK